MSTRLGGESSTDASTREGPTFASACARFRFRSFNFEPGLGGLVFGAVFDGVFSRFASLTPLVLTSLADCSFGVSICSGNSCDEGIAPSLGVAVALPTAFFELPDETFTAAKASSTTSKDVSLLPALLVSVSLFLSPLALLRFIFFRPFFVAASRFLVDSSWSFCWSNSRVLFDESLSLVGIPLFANVSLAAFTSDIGALEYFVALTAI